MEYTLLDAKNIGSFTSYEAVWSAQRRTVGLVDIPVLDEPATEVNVVALITHTQKLSRKEMT